jgi:hypothetical protein
MTEIETSRSNKAGRTNGSSTATATLPADAAAMASDIGQKAMGAAQTTAKGLDDALRRLDTESEGTLTIGAAFSLGLSAGLLLGGGPRLLVLATATPGIAMALALLRRTEGLQPTARPKP